MTHEKISLILVFENIWLLRKIYFLILNKWDKEYQRVRLSKFLKDVHQCILKHTVNVKRLPRSGWLSV